MAAYRVFAELTGQSFYTVRFCQPVITSDFPTIRDQAALVHPRSVSLVSALYDYRLLQLRDLSPDGPNVAGYPYNHLPPPHLLLGYQRMHRALNDYFFENRVFMQLGYDSSPTTQQTRRLYWTCLTDCSYSVNVGAYMRFLDLENFHDSFQQMHDAVLMDRIANDMAQVHLRGRGLNVTLSGAVVRAASADAVAPDAAERAQYLTGSGAGGLQDQILLRAASRRDANLLEAIRRLRVSLCHYLFCYAYDIFTTENTYRFLPGSDVYGEEQWLTLFADAFADLDTQALIRRAMRDPRNRSGRRGDEPADTMVRCFVSTLASRPDTDAAGAAAAAAENVRTLVGGAITLRNRRVPDRPGLRARDRHGRAITAAQARRIRRKAVQNFVDRLPRVTRRRKKGRQETPAPPGAAAADEAPRWGEDEEDEEEEERAEKSAASEDEALLDEVIRTALEAIDALQEELSGPAKRHTLFRFANAFYDLLLRTRESDVALVTESFLRKWVLYFFLAEHVASTLFYLYTQFVADRQFRLYVDVATLQVLIVGWDVNAEPVFRRIWSEQSNPSLIFETLWNRILRDFLLMVERTGQFDGMDEADQQIFLSDIQYRDRSGDIEEVLRQLNLNEELIDSIDISYRIKFRGIVAISTNERIVNNLQQVLRQRDRDAAIARHVPPRMRT
ncbi:pTP [Fowl aviadenovirus 5]|nr:pTP [Fowl aviadenovirus 5]